MNEINTIKDIKSILKKNNWKIFGIAGTSFSRSELYYVAPDFELICSNKTGEFESIENKVKVKLFKIKNKPNTKKPGEILSDKKVLKYIKENSKGKKVGIFTMKSSVEVEEICKENNWTPISVGVKVFSKIDGRLFFCKILKKIHNQKIVKIFNFDDLKNNFNQVFSDFGVKVVVQLMLGAGGRGTFFISKEDDLNEVINKLKERFNLLNKDRQGDKSILVTKFVNGFDFSITGCVTSENGILVSHPRFQAIDIKESVENKNDGSGIFCGGDWSIANSMTDSVQKKASKIVEKIGQEIKKNGHRGIFGVDFILDKKTKEIVPIEINPRLLGSYPTETQIQIDRKEIPLVAFHLLEFLKIEYKIKEKNIYKKDFPRKGSQLLVFNFFGKDVEFKEDIKGGVYTIDKNKLIFLRSGFEIFDIKNPEKEFILTDGLPVKNSIKKKNKKLFRVIYKKSILNNNTKEILLEEGVKIEKIKNEFRKVVINDLEN
jgi:predicted ATP-grasp superfamily ATP-dependent carboligase